MQVLNPEGAPYPVSKDSLLSKPRDLNDIPGCKGDHRTLDKIVDGCCKTTSDRHMWLIPFDGLESEHWLRIDLGEPVPIAALTIWNYNKNLDDTCRGVRLVENASFEIFHCLVDVLKDPNIYAVRQPDENCLSIP